MYDIDTKKRVVEKGIKGDEFEGQEVKILTLLLNRHHYDYLVNKSLAFPDMIEKHKACNICGMIGVSHYSEAGGT